MMSYVVPEPPYSLLLTFWVHATIICTNEPNAGNSISHQSKFKDIFGWLKKLC